jgi:hypothetical protein
MVTFVLPAKHNAVARELQIMWSGNQRARLRNALTALGLILRCETIEWICHTTGMPASRPAKPPITHAFSELACIRAAWHLRSSLLTPAS